MKFAISCVVSLLVVSQVSAQISRIDKLEQSIKQDSSFRVGRHDFKGFVELRKVENDTERVRIEAESAYYSNIQKLGEGKYKLALAAYADQMLEVLKHEYRRVVIQEKEADRQALEIELKINLTLDLKRGITNKGVFIGLDYLFTYVIPSSIVAEQMTKKIENLGLENFMSNKERKDQIKSFNGGSLGQLMLFVKDNDYSFAPWSEGHIIILKMFDGFDKAAYTRIAQLEDHMDKIRKGTLPVWQLPQVK